MNKIWKIGTNIMKYIHEISEYKVKYGSTFKIRHGSTNKQILFDFGNGNIIEKTSSTAGQLIRVLLTLGFIKGNFNKYNLDKSVLRDDEMVIHSLNDHETLGDFIAANLIEKVGNIFDEEAAVLYPSEMKLLISILSVTLSKYNDKYRKIIDEKIIGATSKDLEVYYGEIASLMILSPLVNRLEEIAVPYVVGVSTNAATLLETVNDKPSTKTQPIFAQTNLSGQLVPFAYTFGQFLNDYFTNKNLIEIPVYQRKYIWDKNIVKTLLNDIYSVERINTHYIGNIIVKDSSDGFKTTTRIIDGQQRITTMVLIAKAMFDFAKHKQYQLDKVVNEKLSGNLENNVIVKTFKRIKGNNDFTAFMNVVSSTKPKAKLSSNISTNYVAVINWLVANISNENDFDIFQENFLNRITMVLINAKASNEYVLFEKLNTGSKSLTTLELFKNYILDVFSKNNNGMSDSEAQAMFEKYIESPFTNSTNKDAEVEKFITTILRVENSAINEDTIFNQFKDLIEQKYINNDVMSEYDSVLESIGEDIKLYHEISTYKIYNQSDSRFYKVADFLYMFDGRTVYYPIIIRLIKMLISDLQNPQYDEIRRLREYLRILEIYEVRLQVAIYRGQSLSKKVESILLELDSTTTPIEFWEMVKGNGSNAIATIDQLCEALKTKSIAAKPAKLIMTRLENYYYLNESFEIDKEDVSFRAMYKKPAQREHLLPQEWHEHWFDDLRNWLSEYEDLQIDHETMKYIDYIGNAFPIPDWSNNEIKNQDLFTKINKLSKKQYAKDLFLLDGIPKVLDGIHEQFTHEDILKRSEQIADIARDIWKDYQ